LAEETRSSTTMDAIIYAMAENEKSGVID